jgi:PAS domain S-box-containing protein
MNLILKPVILIIDDSPDIINLLSGLLKHHYKVKTATNGDRGLKIAQSDDSINLILLDVMMPGPSGFEVCEQLKADVKTSDIPIIFLTALSDIEDEQHGLELGAVDYISKPISPAILLARVKNHLKIKAANDILKDNSNQAHVRLDLILNATGEGIYGIDINGNCIFINTSALTMLGYVSQQEVLGKNNHQLFHYAYADGSLYNVQQCPIYKALKGNSNLSSDTEVFWRKDGTSFPVQYQSHPIRQNEKVIGCVISFMDITERKQNERRLIAAKERAENLSKTKSQFLANMSHEIRTPMTAIIGFSELALLKDMPKEVNAYLQNINTASNNLLVILNDILDLSKLEAGKMTLNLKPFSIYDLQTSLHNLLTIVAQSKGLALSIDLANNVPAHLVGDSIRLRQVLTNLLGNAIKFTKQGSVTLSIKLLQHDDQKIRLLFAVTDTGIGIALEQQDKLFQPFSQVDNDFSRNFEGTGLGLVISQNIIQLMGSSIKLDSHVNLGSSFSFELVLPLADLSTIEPQVTSSIILNHEPLSGVRILLAEDDAFNQMLINEVLENLGASVVIANNGFEALATLERESFDLVLMDLHMPTMNGYEATTEIRKQARYALLPVIALSASVTDENKRRCLATGMNDFAGKPIKTKELLPILQQWLIA